jgi:RTX calcium-binding nonapeptide repeat (4 copies)
MSGPTVSGATVAQQFTGGAGATLNSFFNSGTIFTVFSSAGASTVSGPAVVTTPNSALTISGATAVADTSTGGNSITVMTSSVVFAAPNDTVNASTASTILGASAGVTHFTASGSGSSITGGAGGFVGTVSGANSTLVGGTTASIVSVSGANSLAVAGAGGITGINESATSGAETIATNPLGNKGTLVATLGSGADTVLGGSGASTITGGSGNDVFAFIKGHASGSEVIIGFTSSDNLGFAGYGYTASNLPTEAVGPIGDVITLSDGTTITLAGFDHKLF